MQRLIYVKSLGSIGRITRRLGKKMFEVVVPEDIWWSGEYFYNISLEDIEFKCIIQ
jgi:hypothetical protein